MAPGRFSGNSHPRTLTWSIATLAVALVSCGGAAADKAGGRGQAAPAVLAFALPTGGVPPELNAWIAAVDAASNGNIKFDLRPPSSDESWRAGEIDFETGTLSDVAAGTVDMAWIGARAFDLTGVTAFRPLLAPMLVDSHDVQDAVFAAGIPQRMLAAVDSADIVGLGVLPGPMKMVLGVQHPFLEPSDFVGATFGTVDSALTNATLQALGATPRPLPTTAGLDGLDGYEQHAASIVGNHFPETAKYVTANLDLWPRPLVIVINRRRFEQLDHDQQHTLRAAASTAMADAAAAARADDANAAQSLCRDGIQLPLATSDQLTALRAAVQSVYDSLRAQPAASADLTEIERIKAQVSASPDQVKCPPTTNVTTAAPPAARLSGTYQWTITPDDARQHGTEGDRQHASDSFPGTFTMDLADGRWTLSQTTGPEVDRGTYQQVQDRVSFDWDLGGRLIFTFSVDDKGVIRLTPVQPMNAGDAFIWSTEPWHPVETAEPSRTGPPPASG